MTYGINNGEKSIKLELITTSANVFLLPKFTSILNRWNIYKDKDGFYRCKAKNPKDFIEAGAHEILIDETIRPHIKKCEITYQYEDTLYVEDFIKQINENRYI